MKDILDTIKEKNFVDASKHIKNSLSGKIKKLIESEKENMLEAESASMRAFRGNVTKAKKKKSAAKDTLKKEKEGVKIAKKRYKQAKKLV